MDREINNGFAYTESSDTLHVIGLAEDQKAVSHDGKTTILSSLAAARQMENHGDASLAIPGWYVDVSSGYPGNEFSI